jgi:hypothetical protein
MKSAFCPRRAPGSRVHGHGLVGLIGVWHEKLTVTVDGQAP